MKHDTRCFELMKEKATACFFPHIKQVYAAGIHYFMGRAGVQAGEYIEAVMPPLESRRRIQLQQLLDFRAACREDAAAKDRGMEFLAPETVRDIFTCTAHYHMCFPEVRLSVDAAGLLAMDGGWG